MDDVMSVAVLYRPYHLLKEPPCLVLAHLQLVSCFSVFADIPLLCPLQRCN